MQIVELAQAIISTALPIGFLLVNVYVKKPL